MVPIRNGALEAVRWEYVVFSPMIKNTCPNAGTPSPGRPAERARPDAGLAGAAMAAITPAASASTNTNIRPNLGRICQPASISALSGNELQDASRGQVLLVDPHAEGRERVLNRVHYRGRRDDHATFAHAAEVDVGIKGHRLEVRYLDAGNVTGGRHQVVHERG